VVDSDEGIQDFYLGAHSPDLSDEEIDFIHKLWLDVTHEKGLDNVRHKHIVVAALVHLADELHSERRQDVLHFVEALKKGEKPQSRHEWPALAPQVGENAAECLSELRLSHQNPDLSK
jgi:hypothetical protein